MTHASKKCHEQDLPQLTHPLPDKPDKKVLLQMFGNPTYRELANCESPFRNGTGVWEVWWLRFSGRDQTE
jgi:hypothetical protein